jgi:GNAT superfamily N-acetyltransferase
MVATNIAKLPEGYSWATRECILAEDVIALRASVGWFEQDDASSSIERWQACLQDSLCVQGVIEDSSQSLVGIGFIAGNRRHGVLCDLTVHPNHQLKGLARALLYARLHEAKMFGVPYLYTSLSQENTLKSLYLELGFSNTADNLFRADVQP